MNAAFSQLERFAKLMYRIGSMQLVANVAVVWGMLFLSWGATQQVVFQGPCGTITQEETGDVVRARQYSYDENGQLASRSETSEGELRGVTRYTYGNESKLIREEVFDPQNKLKSSVLYSYEAGQLAERSERENDKLERSFSYVYDSAGRLARELLYNRNGDLQQRTEYIYDSNYEDALVSRKDIFDKDDKPTASILYFYNERGDVTLSTRTNSNGDLMEELEYSYDESSNLSSVRKRDNHNGVFITSYDYSCFQ